MPLKIRTLTDPTDPALDAVERIYVAALPGGERKPIAWLRSLPAQINSYRITVAERDAAVIGFAVLFVPVAPSDAALLEYLAVDASARSGGIGGALFAHAVATAARPVLVEIDTDDAGADRRRAFYRRHGCREVIGLQYMLPLPDAPPMGLMVAGTPIVWRHDLTRWLATIYADVYDQSRDDARLARMVEAVGDPVPLAGP